RAIASSRANASEAHSPTPDPPLATVNTPRGGGRLPLRPKRAALQAAQAFATDALLPENPRSPTYCTGLLLLRPCGLVYSALDKLTGEFCTRENVRETGTR